MSRPSPVTITDVARAADCSVATVSRALRGYENVAPATAERVRQVAAELGYRANRHASQLRARTANTLHVLVPRLDDPHYSEVTAGMEAVASESDYDLLVSIGQTSAAVAATLRRIGSTPWVAGAVLVDIDLASVEGFEADDSDQADSDRAGAGSDRPWVCIGAEHPQCASLIVDDFEAGRLAADHLLSLGHRRLGFIGGGPRSAPFVDVDANRRAGFRAAMSEAAEPATSEIARLELEVERSIDGGVAALSSLLTLQPRPTAVVCATSEIAFGLQRAALAVGLGVPADLSIVGIGDWDLGLVSGLTMVRLPTALLGAQAAELLIDRDETDDWPVNRRFGVELVVRLSASRLQP